MKPTIEYRAKAAPKRAAKAVSAAPQPKPGGRWVWVPDDKIVSLRDRDARREHMREYMRKRRAKTPDQS
jgi:hypothetical protein